MLTMSNSFEMYHRQQQQQQQQQQHNSATSTTSILSNNNSSKSIPIGGPGMCGSSSAGGSGGNSPSGAGKESIHSGQFMVSHFEAEEAQDDDDNDNEIKMLDPEDPSLSKPDEPNACTEVQLYMPIKVKEYGSMNTIASHLEIETSLTKLFKCMNLAYSQKLTSPKWNHFKGVRLRWKDKIRLNNVIWRCWHMQFILKRRTPVCQFASPLDVDIHSNPQSVVLEGKYWKRQLAVIKAEYRKWRRNSKSNKTGCMIYDTKSEIDLFEWSLSNDRNLMLPYDWTTDTLFSAINGPFPFPDQREIARGAGNSDFIQPSLGPLQPNLDEIGLTFEELLLQSTRLPPVPEEVSDDMLKSVDYGFPALLGPDHMDSTNIVDVTNQNQGMSNGEDTNMMELNTPLSSMQYSDLERQFQDNANNSLLGSQTDLSNSLMMSGNQSSDSDFNSSPKRPSVKTFPISLDTSTNQSSGTMGKSVIKGRISKTSQRPFRREPHNYDKAQPTLHQTEIYQRLMAERLQQQQQQQQQHQLQHMQHTFGLQLQPPTTSNQSHQTSMQMSQQFSQGMLSNSNNSNNSNNYTVPQAQNLLSLPTNSSIKTYPISTKSNLLPNVKLEASQSAGNVLSMFNISTASTGDAGFHNQTSSSMGNLSQVCPSNGNTSTISFKAYPNVQSPFQKSASTGNYINMRATDASNEAVSQINALFLEQQQQQSQHVQQHSQSLPLQLHPNQLLLPTSATNTSSSSSQQQPQQILPKEMFRSNSLPLNSSLQKLEPRIEHFAVPKYQAKSNNKSRSRSNSNSIQQQNTPSSMVSGMSSGGPTLQIPQLQGATSDPMLNSTLAQLLTAPSLPPPTPNALNTNTNYSPSATSSHAQAQQQSPQQQQQHHAQHQTGQSLPKPISPKKSNSLPVPAPALMIHSPPGNKMLSFPPPSGAHIPTNISLSPDSFNEQDSPLSPTHNLKYPRDTQRRAGHIHAEQKRRYNIKNGFDMLHSLIPQLQQNPNAKLSKAAMLQKGADYIKQLRSERNVLKEKMEALKQERDSLNSSLSHLHSILPANGAPVTRQRTERVRQLYEHYVRCRTMQNWKFWILGLILEPLLASYTTSVSSASTDELRRTVFLWVDQHCSLVDLRPAVSNKLRYLSTTTDILSDPPSTLQEEVAKAINNTPGQHPNLNGS